MLKLQRKLSGLLLVVTLAGVSYLLVRWIPQVAEEYEKAAAFNPYWGYLYLGVIVVIATAAALLVGWGVWLLVANARRKKQARLSQARNPSQMTIAEREQEVKTHLAVTQALADDISLEPELREPIRQSAAALEQKLVAQTLEIVAFGTVSSGKSSLLNALAGRDLFKVDPKAGTTTTRNEIPWPGADRVTLVDTPGLAEIGGVEREQLAQRVARDADLVLFVVDGPLKDFEFRLLAQLGEMEKRVLVCLNKEDWFSERDLKLLAGQIAEQAAGVVKPEQVIPLRAQPLSRMRVRVLADGTEIEETVEEQPNISELSAQMMRSVKHDGRDLLLANLLLRSRGLVADTRTQLQAALDKQAQAIVDRSMWQAAGAAALSPLPVLDVAAAMAISTKMVIELARVYRQDIDLNTATRLISELGKNLLTILGTAMATPAVGSAVASLLKTVPGVGTIAGGVLQGLVQALVTRWIGSVFIAYFRSEMQTPEAGWAALARAKWAEVTRPAELVQLVKTGVSKLQGGNKS